MSITRVLVAARVGTVVCTEAEILTQKSVCDNL
jgi:hypothetical protein